MSIKFRWVEGFDGGIGGDLFDTHEEALQDAKNHVSNEIRLTKKELESIIKKEGGAFVFIEKIELDADGEEVSFDTIDSVEINEKTLRRLY